MPKSLEEMFNQIRQWWAGQAPNQRALALFAGVLFAAGIGGAVFLAGRPDFTVLYSNLSAKDASEITDALREQKVPYRLNAGGTQVEVPSRRVYDLRVQLAGKGLPHGENVGFEIFDKMSLGTTDQVQRINYLRALQSELERTIDSLDAVEKSRVHLVIPEEDLWFEDSYAPTASVLVKLATGGTMLPRQVDSIRHLISSSVRGLIPERVTIVDTQGRVLSAAGDPDGIGGMSERQLTYKKKIEDNFVSQAETLLAEILGPGKAAVRVNAEIDFNQILTERESYTPVVGKQGLVRSEKQNMFESADAAAAAGGTAGTAANLQGYPPAGGSGADKSTRKNERVINYEMNRTLEKINTATGTVRKLSVGVFIDGKYSPEQLADLTSVISRGLGITPERGDIIEVKAFPFNHANLEDEKKLLEKSQRERFWLQVLTRWAPLGLLLGAAVAFLMMGMKSLKKFMQDGGRQHAGQGNGGMEELSSDRILARLKQNSSESAQVLKHWLS